MGTFLTIILALLIFMFFYAKLLVIINKNETDIMTAVKEDGLTQDDKFNASNGLFIAAALTEYDSNPEIIEDWRYGELVISTYGWGYEDEILNARNKLDYQYCSDEELGIKRGANTHVFPIQQKQFEELKLFKKKFKCIPNE